MENIHFFACCAGIPLPLPLHKESFFDKIIGISKDVEKKSRRNRTDREPLRVEKRQGVFFEDGL